MLYQTPSTAKFKFSLRSQWAACRAFSSIMMAFLLVCNALPGHAFVKITDETFNAALIYGMKNQGMGTSTLMGPNWVEGEKGSLLLIFSPFMLLATKASKAGFPSRPTEEDLHKARDKYKRYLIHYTDPQRKNEVKFSLNFFGDTPGFAKGYAARIEGFGRGKEWQLKPRREIRDIQANVYGEAKDSTYIATNAYYFNFNDVQDLQDFRLIVENPATGDKYVFRLRGEILY